MIDIDRYREIGPEAVVKIIRQRIGDMPLYITLDLDCFDTTVAPGVANLEVGRKDCGNGMYCICCAACVASTSSAATLSA